MNAYATIGAAAAVVIAIIFAVPATTPRLRRWPWLVALALLADVRLGPPVH